MSRRLQAVVVCWGLLFSQASWALCWQGDREVSRQQFLQSRACTFSGYCYGWNVNPATGQYEYSYGYNSSCSGQETVMETQVTCENSRGQQYTFTSEVPHTSCQ